MTASRTPRTPNGSTLRYRVSAAGQPDVFYVDNAHDVVSLLVDDYPKIDCPAAHAKRTLVAVVAATDMQTAFNDQAVRRDPTVWRTMSSDQLTILATAKASTIGLIRWAAPMPLTLVASMYDGERPVGNIQWVDPATDQTLVKSLADGGLITITGLRRKAAA